MQWFKAHKVWSAVIAVVILLIIAGAAGGSNTKNAKTTNNSQTKSNSSSTTVAAQSTTPTPSYQLVGTFGQGGQAYVISPNDATQAKLTLIGKELNKKFGNDDFARIGIYTDKSQAQIIVNNPLAPGNLEGAAADAYDKAYVAQFNVNKSTNYKQFVIYLNGSQKDISL